MTTRGVVQGIKKGLQKASILGALFFVLALFPVGLYAAEESSGKGLLNNLENLGRTAGYQNTEQNDSLVVIIANIVNIALSILGVIFLILFIWAGFIWMNAQGDPGRVEEAKSRILQSTIGLFIVMASATITYFVVSNVQKATGG